MLLTIAAALYPGIGISSAWEPYWRLLATLSPLLPSMLFVWYTLSQRLLPLFVERTLAYGGLLVVMFLFHRVTISRLTTAIQERVDFDFILLEVALLAILILSWTPLRRRVLESLRYLLSRNVLEVRDATRRLSVRLSQEATRTPEDLVRWFETAVAQELKLLFVRAEIDDLTTQYRGVPGIDDQSAVNVLRTEVQNREDGVLNRSDEDSPSVVMAMEHLNVMHAFRLRYQSVTDWCCWGQES